MKRKRLVCLLVMAMAWFAGVYGQDVIVTRDSKKIEAVITEVSSDEVKYKKFNYQDGPTFVLKTTEIVTIIYGNGDVQTFVDQSSAQTNQKVEEQPLQPGVVYALYPLYVPSNERFQCIATLNVNYTATHGGPGFDFVFGSRIRDFVFVGFGIGMHTLLNEPYDNYNIITAYYGDFRGYVPVKQHLMPFVDLGLGVHLSVVELPMDYWCAGLYAHVGLGFEYKRFDFSMGYEFNITDNGYFKIGVSF